MVVGLADILVFSGFVAAGLYYRRRPEVHKRLMLLGTVGGLMWPAITRMPYVAGRPIVMFALLSALVLASAVRDLLVRARVHPVSVWGGLLILAALSDSRCDRAYQHLAWLRCLAHSMKR